MISGQLFTRDFLLEGVDRDKAWQSIDSAAFASFCDELRVLAQGMVASSRPNEAETEQTFIYPVLELLGWKDRLVQQTASAKGRKQVPDALLLPSGDAREAAAAEKDEWKRYRYGKAIVEAKRWNRLLDRAGGAGAETKETAPSTQMLQYLSRLDVTTNGAVKLGILTNGCVWRLYNQNTLSVSEEYLEINVAKALGLPGHPLDLFDNADPRLDAERTLRLFYLFFGKQAFLAEQGKPTLHEIARETGKVWEEAVTDELSDLVFETMFPRLVSQLAEHDPNRVKPASDTYLQEVQAAALILLYRLLFVVFAEDRDLLPDAKEPYKSYSLTTMRLDIADKKEKGEFFSSKQATYWPRLNTIFRAIAEGDNELGIPPYNGGLFARNEKSLLERVALPDSVLADLIYDLSHRMENGEARYINYRDLSVQHLGSIYERILDYRLIETASGIGVDEDHAARHISGSYYTPDSLVMLIIEKAVGPLVEERLEAFRKACEALAGDPRSERERLVELKKLDPAQALLRLKICDPAMGSGHFLVSLVDWLADRVLAAIAEAESTIEWSEEPYRSPLSRTIADTRDAILEHAVENKWPYVEDQLDDRHIVRRAVLKRCVFGVDRNPMAVELAKVSLWLHTFTVGAPLSFLDHHLRCGNSLIGEWIRPAMDQLAEWGSPLLMNEAKQGALASAESMRLIERLSDADIGQVAESKRLFADVEQKIGPIVGMLDYVSAARHSGAKGKLGKVAIEHLTRGDFGDPVALVRGSYGVVLPEEVQETALERQKREAASGHKSTLLERAEESVKIIASARNHLSDLTPFHWQVSFVGVWEDWDGDERTGGFDAVIGNPPYVRQELIKEQKPALKTAYPKTYSGTADLYVYFYEQGLRLLRPGGRLSYVVTNKWLKAGYAEKLRDHFSKNAWLDFVADFGHAKHFFPDADVFPSVVVLRQPDDAEPPKQAAICAIPRDEVPQKRLKEAVQEATYFAPRDLFVETPWTLEPKPVLELLTKLHKAGTPLVDIAGPPNLGIKTGFNQAFLIDTLTRDRLVTEHAQASEIIKPYLRGQDCERWQTPWDGQWMIALKSSANHKWKWSSASDEQAAEEEFKTSYPSVYTHLKRFESFRDEPNGPLRGLRHREDQGVFWWELRSCTYYEAFEQPKIVYPDISWTPSFALDKLGAYSNNSGYIFHSSSPEVLATLNSPIVWWLAWREAQHGKDEALRLFGAFMEQLPIPSFSKSAKEKIAFCVEDATARTLRVREGEAAFADWLRLAFNIEKLPQSLDKLSAMGESDALAAILAVFPKRSQPSAMDIARIRKEFGETIAPAHQNWIAIQSLERELSNLVNEAYGLTEEDVSLMWQTAPPRMPFYL